MRSSLLFSTLAVLFTIGCSGGSSPADGSRPNPFSEKSLRWNSEYLAAYAGGKNPSCAGLDRLAQESDAILSPLAGLRFIEHCRHESLAIVELVAMVENAGLSWLRPLALEILIDRARAARNDDALARFALARSRGLNSQREKEDLLNQGLASARRASRAALVLEFETELHRVSPRLNPRPTEAQWMAVADDFRVNERWTSAITYYQKIMNSSGTLILDGLKARNGIREVHKAKFRFHRGPLAAFLNASRDARTYAETKMRNNPAMDFQRRHQFFEAWLQYPRDVWSYGAVANAKTELTRVLALTWLEPVFKAGAMSLQSRIHANLSEWTMAARAGENATQALQTLVVDSTAWTAWHWELWDEAFWNAALAARKNRRLDRAAQLLEVALQHGTNLNAQLRLLFWAGQNEMDTNRPVEARLNWERLAEWDPHGYYGLLAHYKLGRPIQPLADLDLSLIDKPATVSDQDFAIAVNLTACQEDALAQGHARPVLPAASMNLDELKLRAFTRDFATVLNMFFAQIPANERSAFMNRHARLFYPKPFEESVLASASRLPRIEPEYVYAVMRQESGFNRLARSWANAYGLLQMLPGVARAAQRKAGVTFQYDDELFNPSINIPLGMAHMDDVVDSAGSSFIMRTASYNAAAGKVREWRQRLYNGNVFEFLEEIPYEETRSYVRLVMRNYLMNRRLNSTAPFDFPGSLLEM
ncbi:MAG TPA: lytic transglycosylase domain-containing protein [Bdellovibrionales bacterium]|nr:lytic transglycosylase domain-containing protein [Bdellovibrionales bacterium]